MVAFLYDDVSDPRLVILLKTDASLPDRQQLVVQHLHRKMELDLLSKQISMHVFYKTGGQIEESTSTRLILPALRQHAI